MSGVACKPSCMPNRSADKRNAHRRAAYARQRADLERAALDAERRSTEREEQIRRDLIQKQLNDSWGGEREALQRAQAIATELESLRQREVDLLSERDRLITLLRDAGHSWNALASRTGLSRQALSKRT